MEQIRNRFSTKHIGVKVALSVLIGGLLLLIFVELVLNSALNGLEEELISSRLESDIRHLEDLIGEGEWSLQNGGLYHGDTLIGDGTEENAFLEPFLALEEKTGTFSYVFVRCSDHGLQWVGDEETGYQEGHYLRAAGSTRGPDGESIIGTYIDKDVADRLDEFGYYAGEANVVGGQIYCLYHTLKDPQGRVVGLIVVGRSIEEMKSQTRRANLQAFWVIVLTLALVSIGLALVISRWLGAIKKIKAYLDRIGTGIFPERPLRLETQDEIGQVADSINQMTDSLREKERIGAELSLATDIQAHMLPCIFPPFPEHEEIDIYATMDPAKEVGGDFYDFFMLDERRVAVVIADVSGKGVPAALFMVIAKTLIKNFAQTEPTLGDVFTRVNELLCDGNDIGLFVTAWMGVLDMHTGLLTYVNAGHNPPMIRLNGGDYSFLRSRPGFVLAGMEGVRYRQNELQMQPGDRLFLYTDGVTEATSVSKELYGESRLSRYLNAHVRENATAVLHGLKKDIDHFVSWGEQFDDITMLMLDYRKKGGEANERTEL